ncbi:polysaccharide pyruvyl transferase family protein [Patescibacteria group bacterium]|nr:polysaccharide pyruvyl transferase family protein [Patescibacteria group bacterium]MBU1682651.1 polysaccharide pyruvyl transferase family protein [Patescibacteria group bacterium]MBU1935647.1 polysaccharide pyruvyl transferase family protein [Patescibacteria group bacterium]
MEIGVIGNYGATNIGDDAILAAILKNLSGHKITVFSSDPQGTNRQFGVKSVPLFPLGIRSCFKYGFHNSIKALKDVDVVIFGGGGLFQDNYLYACFLWAWQIFWVRFLNKPLFIYGTGVGPLKSWLGKRLTKWAYSQADFITVRDHFSYDLLKKILSFRVSPAKRDESRNEQNICTTADPAFVYRTPEIIKDRTKNLFIISLRPWLQYNSKIISVFTSFLEKLKAEKNADFIFTCMQQIKEHDHRIIDPVLKKVGGELYIPKHFSDLLQVMQAAEFAIGMRYHFLIAALLTKTPVIPISYSPKVDELFKKTSLEPYLIPVRELSVENLEQHLKRLSVDYNNVKIFEKTRLRQLQEAAQKNVDLFDEFIKSFDQN